MQTWSAVVLGVATLLASAAARAQNAPSARLEYIRGAGAEGCPDEARIRDAVATRLGRDPFTTTADSTVRTTIQRVGRGFRARVDIVDATSRVIRSREIASTHDDCREIATSIALTISIAIDPMSIVGPTASQAPAQASSPSPSPAPSSSPSPPPAAPTSSPVPIAAEPTHIRAEPLRYEARLGFVATAGATPGVALGPSIAVGVARRRLAVELDATAGFAPVSANGPNGGRATAMLWVVDLAGCYLVGPARVCALGSLGALQGTGYDLPITHSDTTVVAGIGARGGIDLRVTRALFVALRADFVIALAATSFQLNGADAWTSFPIWVNIAAGLGLRLP